MANTKSAAKRARQTTKRTARNAALVTTLKNKTKRARATGATKADAVALVSDLDKAVKRGVIHKNAANRRKSRLAKKLAAA